jgi:rhodanese-related sulfurtransferase
MLEFAIGIAVVAILLTLKTRGNLALLKESVERMESHQRAGESGADDSLDIQTNRSFISRLAAGETLDPKQVLEGRAWGDVGQLRAIELLNSGVHVLDVRTPQETVAGIIPGAERIPVDDLPMRFGELGDPSVPILVYCAMGMRSAAACEFLSRQGFASLHNLEDGFGSWSGPSEVPDG